MSANVKIKSCSKGIPAGIFTGTEIFVKDEIIYAIYHGERCLFEELPASEKHCFAEKFKEDKTGHYLIKHLLGISSFESAFHQWLFCKFGGLDGIPDCIDGKINPDKYNSACQNITCPGRGVLCGSEIGLKGYQVEMLQHLKDGRGIKEIADIMCVAVPTIKSRISKLKDVFDVSNMAALIGTVSELGV